MSCLLARLPLSPRHRKQYVFPVQFGFDSVRFRVFWGYFLERTTGTMEQTKLVLPFAPSFSCSFRVFRVFRGYLPPSLLSPEILRRKRRPRNTLITRKGHEKKR